MSVPERDGGSRTPVFNAMPPGVVILALAIAGAAGLSAISAPLGNLIFAASVVLIADPGVALPNQPLGPYAPYLLHVLVHFGLLHLAMNLAVLVGAGRAVAYAFGTSPRGTAGFLAFFFTCSVAGAATEALFHTGPVVTLGGASTGVSGLLAGAGWVIGGYRGMLRFCAPWIALNLAIGAFDLAMPIPIGWLAHIGGTVAGALLYPILQPVFAPDRR